MLGDTVLRAEQEGNRISRLFSYNHGEIPFVGKHIILASGSYFSQGLIATSERVYEPVFDLDVTYPEDRNQWYGRNAFDRQPYEGFGEDGNRFPGDGARAGIGKFVCGGSCSGGI